MAPQQEPRDSLTPIYEALLRAAEVDRPVLAPHNLRVYVSESGEMVLVRERAGLPTKAEIAVRIPGGVEYTRFEVELEPWEGLWMKGME